MDWTVKFKCLVGLDIKVASKLDWNRVFTNLLFEICPKIDISKPLIFLVEIAWIAIFYSLISIKNNILILLICFLSGCILHTYKPLKSVVWSFPRVFPFLPFMVFGDVPVIFVKHFVFHVYLNRSLWLNVFACVLARLSTGSLIRVYLALLPYMLK